MNKKCIVAGVLSMMLMTSSTVVNADVAMDAASSVTVSGKVESGESGVNVGIDVFCPDMDYSDAKTVPTSEFARVFAYRGQTKSDENGEWKVTFAIEDNPEWDYDAKSGKYTVVVSPADGTEAYAEYFSYINFDEAEAAIDVLKTGTDDEILQTLEGSGSALGLDYDFYGETDKSDLMDILKKEIAKGALADVTTEEAIEVVRKAALIQGLNEGRVKNLFDYKTVLKLEETEISEFADKDYVKLNGQRISTALKGKNMSDFSDFDEELTKATILSVVKNSDGEGNVKEITDAFANEIGFDAPLSKKAYRAVMGKSYESLGDLGKALVKADEADDSKPSGGGGGGGGGRGASAVAAAPTQGSAIPMAFDIFTDLEQASWAKDAIIYLAQKGIVNGKTETEFFPDDNITREEAVKILVLAFAPDAQAAEISFADADKNAWYHSYIAKAVGAGIVNGYSDTRFGIGDKISREDMVTMIYRAAVNSGITLQTEEIGFADGNDIADYAKEAVGALSKAEIVSGVDFSHFAPKAQATRAQMAKIIYRLLEL